LGSRTECSRDETDGTLWQRDNGQGSHKESQMLQLWTKNSFEFRIIYIGGSYNVMLGGTAKPKKPNS
jgi:hypothetical protein